MEGGGQEPMITTETLRYELEGRFTSIGFGKVHVSVRWEPAPRIVRVGAVISEYTWERRLQTIELLLAFERDHKDEFSLVFDVVPLEAIQDESFAEA